MTPEELRHLIDQPESPSLEFKRQLHLIFDKDKNTKDRHRAEFIRDILSLANGNTTTAGEKAYLIIGVEDDFDPDNGRVVCGVTGDVPTRREILSIIRPASEPPVEDLICETVELESKKVVVITVLPSPHIHETTRRLEPVDGKPYSKYVIFIRSGDSIEIANTKERQAIQDVKAFRYADSLKANPMIVGAMVGSVVGGSVANAYSAKDEMPIVQRGVVAILYAAMCGIFGAVLGNGYRSIFQFRRELQSIPKQWRIPIASGTLALSYGFMYGVWKIFRHWLNR
jgi:Putative DNA-binding domain